MLQLLHMTEMCTKIAWLKQSLMVQGRPIKMRAPILYLANGWMNLKMLLTPNRF